MIGVQGCREVSIGVLVPLDGSELAERVLSAAARPAGVANGCIVLAPARDPRVLTGSVARDLIAAAERVRRSGVTVEPHAAPTAPMPESMADRADPVSDVSVSP
jgi:hypothetical protein